MTRASPTVPCLDLGLSDFAESHELVLCDVWGVLHNGVAFYAAAVDALRRFRAGGGTVVLVTNAPVPRSQVERRLDGLDVPRDAYDGIATSGDVTISLIVEAGCPPLFPIGPADELVVYEEAARLGPHAPDLVPIERAELAVCIGLDGIRERPEDYDPMLRTLRSRGLDLICANPDIIVEVGEEVVFCAGAVAERYARLGGSVIHAGKPFPSIYERAIAMAAAIRGPTPASRVLAIGDAIHTDIVGAGNQGFDALLVTGGIHRPQLHGHDGGIEIDEAKLAALLDRHDARPEAAVPALRW